MARQVHGKEAVHADIATSLHALGAVGYSEGNFVAAKLQWAEALAIRSSTLPLTHPHIKQVEGELQMVEQQIEQQKHGPCYQQHQELRAKVTSRQAKQREQGNAASETPVQQQAAGASDWGRQ
jgi:hypothetical protein